MRGASFFEAGCGKGKRAVRQGLRKQPRCRGEFAGFLREMPGQKKHLRQKPSRQAFRKKAALRAEGKWAFQ